MAIEPIEPIPSAEGLSGVPASANALLTYLYQIHASSAQILLAESEAKASESTAELAADGDSLALARLRADASPAIAQGQDTPALASQHLTHPVGPHEENKGDSVDIYD